MRKILFLLLFFSIISYAQSPQKADQLFGNARYEEAGEIYGQLVRKSPKNTLYTYRYARCRQELGDYWSAVEYFKQSGDRFVLCYFFLGESYMALGMVDEAIASYQTYLAKSKSSDRTDYVQGRLQEASFLRRYLKHVRHVTILDTQRIAKQALLTAYPISQEAGSLSMDERGNVTYMNQRQDRKIFSTTSLTDSLSNVLVSCYRLLDTWTDTDTLSDQVNIARDQNYPFCLSDGVTLYFAAQDTSGMGGWDIYMSQYNSSNNTYMRSENIGFPFNSPANDYLYVVDEFSGYGYWASDRFCPADSVTVYRFRHETTPRYRTQLRSDSLLAYATLRLIEMDSTEQITTDKNIDVQPIQQSISFVLNDKIRYTSVSQFLSQEAKEYFLRYQEENGQLQLLQDELDRLRAQYAAHADKRAELGPMIQTNERVRASLKASASEALRLAQKLEWQAINQ